jgi:hypothetical protein
MKGGYVANQPALEDLIVPVIFMWEKTGVSHEKHLPHPEEKTTD